MAAAAPEMQRWKAMMETFLDPRLYGAGVREGMVLEKLQELLLSLSALVQKLDRVLPPAVEATAPPPHLHDGGAALLLAAVLVSAFSLAGLLYFFFFYFSRAGGGAAGEGGPAVKALKGPHGEGGLPSMSEHECMFMSIGTLLLVITVLGGFYYYYCYQAGCFGSGGGGSEVRRVVGPLAASAGRKLRVL